MTATSTGLGFITEESRAEGGLTFTLANFDVDDSMLRDGHKSYLDARVQQLLGIDAAKELVLVGRAAAVGAETNSTAIADMRSASVLYYLAEQGIPLTMVRVEDAVRQSGEDAGATAVQVRIQRPTVLPVATYSASAAACGTARHPKCGNNKTRAAGLSQLVRNLDALALAFGAKHTILDPNGLMTILDTTVATNARQRLEHTAGLIIDEKDQVRFTRTFTGDLDSSTVNWDKDLKAGDRVVDTIHSHPGGADAEHFSERDITAAKDFAKTNRGALHPNVGSLFYLLTPKTNGGKVLVYTVKTDTVTEV